jgi:general secretion pathway protein H
MPRRAAGFTLLEVMVVLIIIATIMAIAIPRVNDLFEVNLKSSIRKLGGAIQFCFNESVIRQTPLRLNVNLDTGEYWLSYMTTQGSTGEFLEVPSDIVQRERLPEGIFFKSLTTPHNLEKRTEGEDFITFFPTGFVEATVLHLGARDGRAFTVLVKSLTGRIAVYDREIDFADLGPQVGGAGTTAGLTVGVQF